MRGVGVGVVVSVALSLLCALGTVRADCSAPTTCYGEDCDYWVVADDYSCNELEDSGCDCTGCLCGDPCPATCFSQTCDYWTATVSCSDLSPIPLAHATDVSVQTQSPCR